MTDSRETMRRKAWADRAPGPLLTEVDPRTLCIVHGCLNPRVGANLCRRCDNESDPR